MGRGDGVEGGEGERRAGWEEERWETGTGHSLGRFGWGADKERRGIGRDNLVGGQLLGRGMGCRGNRNGKDLIRIVINFTRISLQYNNFTKLSLRNSQDPNRSDAEGRPAIAKTLESP